MPLSTLAASLALLLLQTAPAVPTTRADTVEEATVRETALKFADALMGSDLDLLKAMYAGDADDVPALLGLNRLLRSQVKLREAVMAKLPDKGGRMGLGADQRELARTAILASPIAITGNAATISQPNGQVGYKLVKKEGGWMVDTVPSLANIKPMLAMLVPTAQAMSEVADEVNAGKYHNEMEVRQAILARAQAIKSGATSQPATRP